MQDLIKSVCLQLDEIFKIGLENGSGVLGFGRVCSYANKLLTNESARQSQPFLRAPGLRKWPLSFYKSLANYWNRNLEEFSPDFDCVRFLGKKMIRWAQASFKDRSLTAAFVQSLWRVTCGVENFSSLKQVSIENLHRQKSGFGKGNYRASGDLKDLMHAQKRGKCVCHPQWRST